MSNLSVNNFPRLTNDFNQQNADLPKSVDKSAGEIRANTPGTVLKNNPAVGTDGTVTFNKDALEKLFELFEYAFKAIRNMLSGQGGMPKLVPDAGPLPKHEKSSDTPVKDKADSKSNVPDTAAKDKAGTDSQVPNTVAKDKAETNSQVLNTALKDKAETNSQVLNTALKNKSGTNPDGSVQRDKPANNPAVPSSEVKVTPKPLPEPRRPDHAPGKDVQPNSRSSSDVNVTVQVMNCHCPHPDATKPVPPKPDVPLPIPAVPVPPNPDAPVPAKPAVPVPPKPDAPVPAKPAVPVPPKPDAPLPAKPDVPVPAKPDAPVPAKPDAPLPPKPDAPLPPKPDAPVPPKPDAPKPDITSPGPSEDVLEFEASGRRRAFDSDWRFNPGRRISR